MGPFLYKYFEKGIKRREGATKMDLTGHNFAHYGADRLPTMSEFTYRCSHCGHEFTGVKDQNRKHKGCSKDKEALHVDCPNGCSHKRLWGFLWEEQLGVGIVIKEKVLYEGRLVVNSRKRR